MVEIFIKLFVKGPGPFLHPVRFCGHLLQLRRGIKLSDFLRYFRAVQNFFD